MRRRRSLGGKDCRHPHTQEEVVLATLIGGLAGGPESAAARRRERIRTAASSAETLSGSGLAVCLLAWAGPQRRERATKAPGRCCLPR